MAGAQVGEIDAPLLTFKIRSDRPVWGEQSGEPVVSGRPSADIRVRDRRTGEDWLQSAASGRIEASQGRLPDQGQSAIGSRVSKESGSIQ